MASRLKIIAHRGGAALAPENSPAAALEAMELGVYAIEADVRRTRDGEYVVCHDADLSRLAGRPEAIDRLAWPELAGVVVGCDDTYGPQTLLRLADLIELTRGHARLLLDLKLPPGREAELLRAIQAAGVGEGQVILGVRSLESLSAFRLVAPGLATVALAHPLDAVWPLARAGAAIVRLLSDWVDEASLRQASELGRPVWVLCGAPGEGAGSLATVEELVAYRRLGVQGVVLDDPRLALQANAIPAS